MDTGSKIGLAGLIVALVALPAAWLAVPGFSEWILGKPTVSEVKPGSQISLGDNSPNITSSDNSSVSVQIGNKPPIHPELQRSLGDDGSEFVPDGGHKPSPNDNIDNLIVLEDKSDYLKISVACTYSGDREPLDDVTVEALPLLEDGSRIHGATSEGNEIKIGQTHPVIEMKYSNPDPHDSSGPRRPVKSVHIRVCLQEGKENFHCEIFPYSKVWD